MIARLSGAELYYAVHGSGRPVLVMHGGLGLDHTYFRPWLDPLGKQARLVFYDHFGNGRSARPATFDGISHDTWSQDADALRDYLGHPCLVVLGHSYGGYLALEYALRFPERVAGLILCCTAASSVSPDCMLEAAERLDLRRTAERVLGLLAEGISGDDRFAELFSEILPDYFGPRGCPPELVSEMVAATRFCAAALNHAFSHCAPSFDLTERLASLPMPSLIVAGRYDWVMPLATTAEPLNEMLPDSHLTVFEESGHYPFIEERDRFLATVSRWLQSLPV